MVRFLTAACVLALTCSASAGGPTKDEVLVDVRGAMRALREVDELLRGSGLNEATAVEAAEKVRQAEALVQAAEDTLNSILGKPNFSIKALRTTWTDRWVLRSVPVVGRDGRPTRVQKRVKAGGWMRIKVKITLESAPQPIVSSKMAVTIEGMEGGKYDWAWRPGKSTVKPGKAITDDLVIAVHEDEMEGFWLKDTALKFINQDLRVDAVAVRYEDGTRMEWPLLPEGRVK